MIGWLAALAAVALLLSMKVGLNLRWESGTAILKVRVGPVRFSLSTSKKTKKTADDNTGKSIKKQNQPVTKKWVKAVLAHWREFLQLIGKILRAPQLDLLSLQIKVGDTDPEKCAMQYGRLCAGLSAGLPLVERVIPIQKKEIHVDCDFALHKSDIFAEAEATVRVAEIFALAAAALLLLVKIYRQVKNNEKAVGAQ